MDVDESDTDSLPSPMSEEPSLSTLSGHGTHESAPSSSTGLINLLPFKPQKELKYNNNLPYWSCIPSEAVEFLTNIKANIARSLLVSDPRTFWIYELSKYIRLYGRMFSKEDHLYFIHLLMEVIQIPDISASRLMTCSSLLTTLLKKRELLSRDDLEIQWRPLYELYQARIYSSNNIVVISGLDSNLKSLLRAARVYYPMSSTADILEEFRPYLCPYDKGMNRGLLYMELLLPTVTAKPEEHKDGYRLWLEELMSIWDSNPNSPEWEQQIVLLFARLAHDTIGYIDWSPWIPKIFTHLMKSFDLQNGSVRVQVKRNYRVFDMNAVVLWIVSMMTGAKDDITLSHIEMMFKSLESYYYPSNRGNWNDKLSQLLSKLPNAFVKRLHRERFKKRTWEPIVPESHQLSEETITRFTNALVPIINIAMFAPVGMNDASVAMQHLATVRPSQVITPLLDKMYRSFESLTEPHRLFSCLLCALRIARSLVLGGKDFPEGPSHVIPLLMALLPGIDPNDIRKSSMTFQFVSVVSSLITYVDCSSAIDVRDDLSPEEYNMCLASTQLESFVLQYFDRCFTLIETSASEHRPERQDSDSARLSTQESLIEMGISSTLAGLVVHSSASIMDKAIDKLFSFMENRIFETKVAGKFVASMVLAVVRGSPDKVRSKFIPHFHRIIMNLTSDVNPPSTSSSGHEDEELIFSLQITSEVVRGGSQSLSKYRSQIIGILERTLHSKTKKVSSLSSQLLSNALKSLTQMSIKYRDETLETEDFTKSLPIRSWGNTLELDDIKPVFFVPSQADHEFAQELVQKFLEKETNWLESWTEGKLMESPTREDINRSLNIITNGIEGAIVCFPYWSGDLIPNDQNHYSPGIEEPTWRVKEIGSKTIVFSDGSNVRETIARKIRKVLSHLQGNHEDDVKSLRAVINIYFDVMFYYGIRNQEFNTRWKSFAISKSAMENKLLGCRKHTRLVLLDRIMLQQELRMNQMTFTKFTPLHRELMDDLVKLSTSFYAEIRRKAQELVNIHFSYFPLHVTFIADALLAHVHKNSDSSHESFKGALYVIVGENGKSLLNVSDWKLQHKIWLSFVNAKHSEKPSIFKLLNNGVEFISQHYEPLPFSFKVTPEVTTLAKKAWTGSGVVVDKLLMPSQEAIERGLAFQDKERETNILQYQQTCRELAKSVEDGSLHWHYEYVVYGMLSFMIRMDAKMPVEAVAVITKNLINDTILVRKFCFSNFPNLMKTLKRKHVKKIIEPVDRRSNKWLQYDPKIDYTEEKTWKSINFLFKNHIGFYAYPKEGIRVIDYDNEPSVARTRDELTPEEIPIFDFFSDQEKVDKLLYFFSLEERKGVDKFSTYRYSLWRSLFKTFGTAFLPRFQEKMKKFVCSDQESQQRAASEFIAGLVRGSKHWPFEEHVKMKQFAEPIVRDALKNILPETLTDWGTCCATIFEREDGRRISWFVELVTDDPLNSKLSYEEEPMEEASKGKETSTSSSFLHSSRIYCLMGVIQQQQWRDLKVLQNLTEYLKSGQHLTQSFQIVRQRIGVLLANIFTYDVDVPCLPGTLDDAPRRDDFVEFVLPQLEPLMNEQPNSLNAVNGVTGVPEQTPEKKAATNLIKSVVQWIVQNFNKNSCSTSTGLFKLLPFLCQVQTETTDEELMSAAKSAFVVFSHTMLTTEGIDCALEYVKKILVGKSWRSRTAIAMYLQYMIATNLFKIRGNPRYVKDVTQIVLSLLEDERVEVREAGATIFGGLIHCEFIPFTEELRQTLFKKSNHVIRKSRNPQNSMQVILDSGDVVIRHAGILGLCSVVNAFPYEVPSFLPRLLLLLSSHLNDPAPIPMTIKKTMNSFKRTHADDWSVHKEKFSEDELLELTNVLVSPTYYA